MFRIGMIGTENSHSIEFAKLINNPDEKTGKPLYPDVKVAGVLNDSKEAQKIIDEANVPNLYEKVEDFFGNVDVMIVTNRRGSEHYENSIEFIKKGIPMFIDKPITIDTKQGIEMFKEAKKNNVPVFGGSGCKELYDVITLKGQVERAVKSDQMISASMNFHADLQDVYDGLYFYSPHLIEMALTIFGYDVKSVAAFGREHDVTAILRYDLYDITLHFTYKVGQYSALILTKNKNYYREIDMQNIYEHEMESFVQMLRTGEMPFSYEQLLLPTEIITCILESIKTGKEVEVNPIEI